MCFLTSCWGYMVVGRLAAHPQKWFTQALFLVEIATYEIGAEKELLQHRAIYCGVRASTRSKVCVMGCLARRPRYRFFYGFLRAPMYLGALQGAQKGS